MTLDDVLAEVRAEVVEGGQLNLTALRARLVDREENIADFIRLAGVQFGTYPEIVAKVLMDAGLGEPPSDELRDMINRQFSELLLRLQQEQQGDQ